MSTTYIAVSDSTSRLTVSVLPALHPIPGSPFSDVYLHSPFGWLRSDGSLLPSVVFRCSTYARRLLCAEQVASKSSSSCSRSSLFYSMSWCRLHRRRVRRRWPHLPKSGKTTKLLHPGVSVAEVLSAGKEGSRFRFAQRVCFTAYANHRQAFKGLPRGCDKILWLSWWWKAFLQPLYLLNFYWLININIIFSWE